MGKEKGSIGTAGLAGSSREKDACRTYQDQSVWAPAHYSGPTTFQFLQLTYFCLDVNFNFAIPFLLQGFNSQLKGEMATVNLEFGQMQTFATQLHHFFSISITPSAMNVPLCQQRAITRAKQYDKIEEYKIFSQGAGVHTCTV